jgi:hypothetical protein
MKKETSSIFYWFGNQSMSIFASPAFSPVSGRSQVAESFGNRGSKERENILDGQIAGSPPQRPFTNDPEEWQVYWEALDQPWRWEPEIDAQSQAYLRSRLAITPNVRDGIYPFKDIAFKLQRAHIEWIVACLGPIDWSDKKQRKRLGPDFRGADLRGLDLSQLPLVRGRFGMTFNQWRKATQEQQEQASAHLEGAKLWGANLEGARFFGAHLEGARLANAYIQGAQFRKSRLDRADLHSIHVKGTDFKGATISDTRGRGPRVADIEWLDTKLWQLPWRNVMVLGDEIHVREAERARVPHDELLEAYEEAIRAHEELANTLQSKGMDASRFRYRGKVLQRQLLWKQHIWQGWLGSMLLALIAGYGYRLWRIVIFYGLTLMAWTLLYTVFCPHLSIWDAMLVACTDHGLPADASVQAWIVHGCEYDCNNYFMSPLIVAMLLQRLLGK